MRWACAARARTFFKRTKREHLGNRVPAAGQTAHHPPPPPQKKKKNAHSPYLQASAHRRRSAKLSLVICRISLGGQAKILLRPERCCCCCCCCCCCGHRVSSRWQEKTKERASIISCRRGWSSSWACSCRCACPTEPVRCRVRFERKSPKNKSAAEKEQKRGGGVAHEHKERN